MQITNTKIIHGSWSLAVFCSAVLGLAVPLAAEAVDMQEGQWENTISMTMENPNLPFQMPAMKFTTNSCLTKKDMVPNTARKDQKCETTDYKVNGNTVNWKSKCEYKNSITEGTGEIVYKGTTYEGTMHMTTTTSDSRAKPMNISYVLNGKNMGACGK